MADAAGRSTVNGILALAEKIPNADAVAISPTMGWLLLTAATCVALLMILHADKWRRWWLTAAYAPSLCTRQP